MHYPIDLEALPRTWDKGYVGDFALEIQPGFASGKHNKEGRGIPHIRPYNIDRSGKLDLSEIKSVAPNEDTKRLRSGDVLFNNTNSPELIGKTTVVGAAGDWGFSNHMTRVVFSEDVSPKFGAYQLHYLWSRGYFLHNCVKHVNQASVSSTTLARAVPFVKPPRPQQDRIVAEIEKQFSRLDEAVASLKRTKVNLKRYKAAVLKAAVEGKLTEDWRKHHPDVEPASKLLERILAERRAKWNGKGKYKESCKPNTNSLEPIPHSWAWASLEQVCPRFVDSAHRTPRYGQSGVPALGPRDVVAGELNVTDARLVDEAEYATQTERHVPEAGDIVYSRELSLGWAAILPPGLRVCLSQGMCLFRPHEAVNPRYFMIVLNGPHGRHQAELAATGSAHPHVNLGDIRKYSIPIPPSPEQEQLVAEVERRLSLIDELQASVEASLTRADRLRQSALKDAFNGRLVSSGKGK
jgi:type I restriction enzyme, S subunit